jgi:NADH-quinone oxidoreductase subunit G
MTKIYIDNIPYEVKPGKNLLEACLSLNLNLPYFCWHSALGSVGACRQCAVKVFRDETDTRGRLIMSCMEPVREEIRISIDDLEAKEFRGHVIEWLMTNHPHDCAVCDEGGSCHLQDMTVMSGHAYRRFTYPKRTYHNQYLGPFLNHEMNRCIQCYRCVRYYKDYAGGKDLDVYSAHNHVYFGRQEDGVLESEFSGNLAEVCPTGVFTDKTLKQHYTRKWDLTMAPSVCQHCSLGCNISAGERYGSLRQIINRYNGEVNGHFICDRGRFGYEFVNSLGRLRRPMVRFPKTQALSKAEALLVVRESMKAGKVIGIGSPRASLESNFALKELVGADNFHHGVSDVEHDLMALTLKILRESPARALSLQEVEQADAVLVLGEDLTNTAPMLALAVRQSVRQQPMEQVAQAQIPEWQDAAVRELIQENKGPLFQATVTPTKLDEIAKQTCFGTPDTIARLGFAVAALIGEKSAALPDLSPPRKALSQEIAYALIKAKRPLVISGVSSGSESVLKAAANVVQALCALGKPSGIVLAGAECNSLGLAMVEGHKLSSAFEAIQNGYADSAIILENDLYRRAGAGAVTGFLEGCKQVILLDHLPNATTEKATLLLPSSTFAEADGTLVNNEGRAQRFFQVFPPVQDTQESWRWLLEIGRTIGHPTLSGCRSFDDLWRALADSSPILKGVEAVAPPAEFRVSGLKIPRASHRYSGRTAMTAHLGVSEPKPPEDPESPLSFTMEGYRGQPPSSLTPFFWSPGWNSGQSVHKYQQEVGGPLRNGDPGVRLIEPSATCAAPYYVAIPPTFKAMEGHLFMIGLPHIFGSEELSIWTPGIAERAPAPYVMLNQEDAEDLNLAEGEFLNFKIAGDAFHLPVTASPVFPKGIAGLPVGLPGVPFAELPAWAIIKADETDKKWKQQPQPTF